MWNYVDEQLKKYLKEHRINDRELEYRIQNVFNMGFEFSTLYQYANKETLRQFKTRIRLFKEKYNKNNYVSYMVNKYQNRTLVKNNEILKVMLLMEYAEIYEKNYANQIELFEEVSKKVVKVTNEEVKPKIPRKKRRHPYVYEHMALLHFLAMPNNLGVAWDEHVASIVDYNADQTYKQAVIDLRENKLQVHKDLIDKQSKREINYKSNRAKDKFFGQIDNELTYLVNQERVQIFEYYGIKRVQFKALIDDRTTEQCREMNGKIIGINDLVLGENMPPLHYNCRSILEAWSVK